MAVSRTLKKDHTAKSETEWQIIYSEWVSIDQVINVSPFRYGDYTKTIMQRLSSSHVS